ncbi:MAG TPA: hypothetical protein ENG66_07355 [Thermococcus sp.]|nr:hypothetical protein [Thermococcus sp.]
MRLVRNLKAISPLIATIILIAIAVAGGLLVYALFTSTTGVAATKGQVQIESMDLVKSTGEDVIFTITIKNVGSKPVTELKITLNGEDTAVIPLSSDPLQPGQSYSYSASSKAGELTKTYVVGNSYIVEVDAKYSDESTSSIVTSVMCRS